MSGAPGDVQPVMTTVGYKKYLLSVLMVILAFNYVDRQALGLVLQDIKADLDLSDTQLGLLSGIAFALFYSVMGIPIARWADRGNRVAIISVTTLLWSLAVALCGGAANFVQLLLVRVGVAVGEAGCIPPAHSLIADYFTRAERPKAVSQYFLGGPLSVVVGFFVAGWLNELYGWRIMFMLLGLPGVVLAALAWLTLKEPRRGGTASLPVQQPAIGEVCAALWARRTFRHLLWNFSVTCFFNYGTIQWQSAFFIRSYGMETGTLGTWFALVFGIGGILGMYWGGQLASRYAARDESLQLKAIAIAYSVFAIIQAGAYVIPDRYVAFALLAIATVAGGATAGPLFATLQTLVPSRMRAMSIALLYLFANLVGMGLGPLAVGVLSDALRPAFGEESLRFALLAMCPGYLWGAWHLWLASRSVKDDVSSV